MFHLRLFFITAVGGVCLGCGEDASGGAADAETCEAPAVDPESVVWIDSGVVRHDRDYHSFGDALDAAVPKDWTCPVDYAGGTYTLEVEVVSLSNEAAQPIFYTVGWGRPEETRRTDDAEYVRTAVRIDAGATTYVAEGRVKDLQQVIDGVDAGPVGDDWDWSNAWDTPNGDAFDIDSEQDPYPLEVRVKLTLHPAQ